MVPRLPSSQKLCLIFLCLGATLAPAADAPYTENFDTYPNGAVPANFVETTDADWAISSNGTSGSYIGSIGITGGQKSSSTLISLDNVAGHNFTFRTKFTITSVSDLFGGVGKFVDLGFTGPGYELVYKPVAGGTTYTNQFYLTGNSLGTYFAAGTKPCQVMIHGAYVDTNLFLTAEVSDGVNTVSMRSLYLVAGSANNTKFGYTQTVGGSSFRTGGVGVSYDDFSVLFETFPVKLGNLSTRVNVGTGEQVAIAGFIITGNSPRRILIRGLRFDQFSGFDAVLELLRPDGTQIAFNDNWKTTQQQEISSAGLSPYYDGDSALIATLAPGAYTAILRNKNDGPTRLGMVEAYDLTTGSSGLGNISTRGFVGTGDNVMIGGVIVSGDGKARVIVRALGPSLRAAGINQPLEDPTLELRGPYGTVAIANDNWGDSQKAEIANTSLAPPNDAEAAIVADLLPTNYTAIVRGKNDTTGVALVEVYHLN
jgi:hypothetical protein